MEAHAQWAKRPHDQRYHSLDELAQAVNNRRARSRAVDIDCSRIEAKFDDGKLQLNGTIQPCEPTHWAFGQISQHIGAPANYLRTLEKEPELLVNNLNFGIKNNPARDAVKFMTIADEDGTNTLQAVTSTTYGRIWDADCVAAVQRIQERSGGKFQSPLAYAHKRNADVNGFGSIDTGTIERAGLYASDRDVFMFLIDGGSRLEVKNDRGGLHRGFIVFNSETGSRTFGLMTFLFRECCGNNIIYGAQDVNKLLIRHSSGGPYRFDAQAMPALKAYVESSTQAEAATINKAADLLICDGTFDKFSEFLNRSGKFTKAEIRGGYDFAKAEEGAAQTLWQAVQGLTAYARGFDWIDARVDLEKRAGALLKLAESSKPLTIAV